MLRLLTLIFVCVCTFACTGTMENPSSDSSQSSTVLSSQSSSIASSNSNTSSNASSVPASTCNDNDVQNVFSDNNCLLCHSAQIFAINGGGLNLESDTLGRDMLDKATRYGGQSCAEEKLISQGKPEESLLLKLVNRDLHTALDATSCKRQPMPQNKQFMSQKDFQCLSSWVKAVAENEQPLDNGNSSSSVSFEPTLAPEVLSKVKYVLHGGAPTQAELESLGGPSAFAESQNIKSLIQSWESSPEYKKKIERFFKLAFQVAIVGQSPRVTYEPQFGALHNAVPRDKQRYAQLYVDVLESMFTKMAWDIYINDHAFSEVITTRKWKVNSAILSAFAWMDTGILRRFGTHGENFSNFVDSDFTDWRTVTIEQGDERYPFGNSAVYMNTLRNIPDGGTFKTRFPRVGFFSNPAFLGTWDTNVDNQFRVVTQQALIVALDKAFDPSDTTPHLREDGIPLNHADPNTVCYQCHRHMDPMRLVFTNTQNIRNQAIVPLTIDQPTFSFHGLSKDFTTIDEFAEILATHPEFPIAWIQKLCMWGNSQRCDSQDPEFKRIVNTFKNNNLNYKLAVREFFSSPLFTGTASTQTHESKEYLLSLSRGDHLCSAMDTRLKAIQSENGTEAHNLEVCPRRCDNVKNAKKFSYCQDELHFGLIPPDFFARAEVDFMQVKQLGAFSAKSLDLKCANLSNSVVAEDDTKIINVNGNTNALLKQLVTHVMGLPQNHPRHISSLKELKRVYAISSHTQSCAGSTLGARGAVSCGLGLNKLESMRNAFFVACTSPDILSVGL